MTVVAVETVTVVVAEIVVAVEIVVAAAVEIVAVAAAVEIVAVAAVENAADNFTKSPKNCFSGKTLNSGLDFRMVWLLLQPLTKNRVFEPVFVKNQAINLLFVMLQPKMT